MEAVRPGQSVENGAGVYKMIDLGTSEIIIPSLHEMKGDPEIRQRNWLVNGRAGS